jgi:hypothetical protein
MNNKVNYINKYKKYKIKYLKLKVLYGGEVKEYKVLGYYLEKNLREAYEQLDWGKFKPIKKLFYICFMCCECLLDKKKIIIRLSDSEMQGSDRIESNAYMSIIEVSEFTHRFTYIPKNPEASIHIDIHKNYEEYSCKYFNFTYRGDDHYDEGLYNIKRSEFIENPIPETPFSFPEHLVQGPTSPIIWGFEYKHQFVKKGGISTGKIFYSDDNQKIIQKAILYGLPFININHIGLTGQHEGKSYIHRIDLINYRVHNETTGANNKLIYKHLTEL